MAQENPIINKENSIKEAYKNKKDRMEYYWKILVTFYSMRNGKRLCSCRCQIDKILGKLTALSKGKHAFLWKNYKLGKYEFWKFDAKSKYAHN